MEATFRSLTLQLTQISDQIISQPEAVNSQSKELMELVRAVDRFAKLTKGPMDYVMGLMTTMTQFTALRLFNEWNAADHIPVDDAISYEELAAKLDADVSLISKTSLAFKENSHLLTTQLQPGYLGT
jgi:thiamine biosynthesis lipoprotein ApbE